MKCPAPYGPVLTKISKCHNILNLKCHKIIKLKFWKVHRMTPNQTQGIGHHNYPTYVHSTNPIPKFSTVALYDQPFQDIAQFRIFPLTPILKVQSATKFRVLADRQNIYNFI